MLGKIIDISTQGAISIVVLEINDKVKYVYAETHLFLNAIYEAFGDKWRNKMIDFNVTDYNLITDFSTLPEKIKPIGPFKVCEKDGNTYELNDIGMSKNPLVFSSVVWVYCNQPLLVGKTYKGKVSFDSLQNGLPIFIPEKVDK